MILDYENPLEEDYDELDLDDYEDPDYEYDEELGKQFEREIKAILDDLIAEDTLTEDFTSGTSLRQHFNKHCIGSSGRRRSTTTNVLYDFERCIDFGNYERDISNKIRTTLDEVTTLRDYELIVRYLRKLFEGNMIVKFTLDCGLHNSNGAVYMSIIAFSSDVTTNYSGGNTIDICIKTPQNRTITIYPIDAHRLQSRFNNLIRDFGQYEDRDLIFNND